MYRKTTIVIVSSCLLFFMAATAQAAKFQVGDVENMTIDFWGFSQLTMEQFDRQDTSGDPDLGDRDSFEFDADRVRFGAKVRWGQWFGNLHLDANSSSSAKRVGGLSGFIRDANAGYKFSNAAKIKLGQFKTPLGMAFNGSGSKLPLPKRTFTDRLAFDRTLGIMLSGRKMGGAKGSGFGYDLFVGNPVGRAGTASQTSDQIGDEHTWVARIMYDLGKNLHIETAYGEVGEAGGQGTEDLETFDIGIAGKLSPAIKYRAEFIQSDNVRGKADDEEEAWFVELAYAFDKMLEGVIRYEEAEFDSTDDSDIDAFEVGLNMYMGQNKKNNRLQVSYRSVGGDEEDYKGRAATGGFADHKWDAFLAQFQFFY